MKLYGSFALRANKALLLLGCFRSQWGACWHWQPRCILVAAVRRAPAAGRRRSASRPRRTTELRVAGRRQLTVTAVGTEQVRRHTHTDTHTQRLCAVFFLGALTAPKVDLCKNAVRIGNSSRLRGRRGLSRGAQNLLRAEESTAEKQVSWEAEEDSYSPSCGAFGVEVIIGGCWLLWELSGASPPPPVSSQHPSRWPRSQVVSRSLLLSCWTWSYATFGCCLVNINFKY